MLIWCIVCVCGSINQSGDLDLGLLNRFTDYPCDAWVSILPILGSSGLSVRKLGRSMRQTDGRTDTAYHFIMLPPYVGWEHNNGAVLSVIDNDCGI